MRKKITQKALIKKYWNGKSQAEKRNTSPQQ